MSTKPSARQEQVYAMLDGLVQDVGALQGIAYRAGNFNDASWLACAEDALQRFADRFDDVVDNEAERRWDRKQTRDLEDGVSGADELAYLQAEARGVK